MRPFSTSILLRSALLICSFLLLFVYNANADFDAGIITGRISTSDGKAAANVTIQISGTKRSAISDQQGNFIIRHLPAGKYELKVSLIGYKTLIKTIELADKQTLHINLQLELTSQELDAVMVSYRRTHYGTAGSEYVAKMPLKNLENPQVYSAIDKQLLKDQLIVDFSDALKNSAGIDKLWSSTGRGNDGAGYYSLRGFATQPTLINGLAGISNGSPDPAGIERIEVIKGPSGTLFGSSLISFGGLINIVSKQPYDSLGAELGYTAGSYGLSRLTADINAPLTRNKDAAIRINTAFQKQNSFQDAGFSQSLYFAPSFSYRASEKLNFLLSADLYTAKATNPVMYFLNRSRPLEATNPAALHLDYSKSFTSNDIQVSTPVTQIRAAINYRISSRWTSQTLLAQSSRKSEGLYQYIMFILPGDSLLNRYMSNQYATNEVSNLQQNFLGELELGKTRHRILVGFDYYVNQGINNSSAYILYDTVKSNGHDPQYGQLTAESVHGRIAGNTAPTKTKTRNGSYAFYASDVINLTDRWLAMLSLRVDRFENKGSFNIRTGVRSGAYQQTSLSPKFGLVYQIVKDRVALFANYINGFKNVAPVNQSTGEVSVFKPQQANQLESGIKLQSGGDKFQLILSAYDITVDNITRNITENINGDFYNIVIQDGRQRSRGLELELNAAPLSGLAIRGSYAYNESKILKSDASVEKRRPVSAGPAHLANGWLQYQCRAASVKGLGLGAGFNYASENMITNNSITGVFTIPSYTIFNASLFYDRERYRLALKLDNLTDLHYWKGWTTLEPQMPRRISANLSFRF